MKSSDVQFEEPVKVFISYSRKDIDFTTKLAAQLSAHGYLPDYDQQVSDPLNVVTGISAQDEWWQRLQEMIITSDVMIFVASPASASSAVCDEEIAFARAMGKRIIPILRSPINFLRVPPRLSALNIKIDFTSDDITSFCTSLDVLCRELDTNIEWHREHCRLSVLSARWESSQRSEELLLSAADVRAVGLLNERRPNTSAQLSASLLEIREQSQSKLDENEKILRRITGQAFVNPALQALSEGAPERALRIAAAGIVLSRDFGLEPALGTQLAIPIQRAALERRTILALGAGAMHRHSRPLSPDDRLVAISQGDASIVIYDAATLEVMHELKEYSKKISSLCFAPTSECLLITSEEPIAKIWNARTGIKTGDLVGHSGGIRFGIYSPAGCTIATASADKTVRVWDAESLSCIARLDCRSRIPQSLAFNRSGTNLITTELGLFVNIWDISSGRLIGLLEGHSSQVCEAVFSPDCTRIASASADKTARIWDVSTNEQVMELAGHSGAVLLARYAPNASFIATASSDGTAIIWDADSGKVLQHLRGHTGIVTIVEFSDDSSRLMTASTDGTVKVWDVDSGKLITTYGDHGHIIESISFNSSGQRVLSTAGNRTVRLWDASTSRQLAILSSDYKAVRSVAWNPANNDVAMACANVAVLADVDTGSHIRTFEEHSDLIFQLAISADGRRLATASRDNTARLWSLEDGRSRFNF